MILTKHFKRFLHTLFPKMCTSNYRWNNDWLICDCGQKLGFRLHKTDDDGNEQEYKFIFPQYKGYIEGDN